MSLSLIAGLLDLNERGRRIVWSWVAVLGQMDGRSLVQGGRTGCLAIGSRCTGPTVFCGVP